MQEPDLQSLLKQAENSGTRRSSDIVDRYIRKREEVTDEQLFIKAIKFIQEISEKGAAADISKIISTYSLKSSHFERIMFLLSFLGAKDFKVGINFALVPDMAYYSGFVFQIRDEKSGKVLASGGRYDDLFKTLGGKTTPARGFACPVEDIVEAARVS